MKLIDEWKESWKYLSIQINTLGIFILALLAEMPSHLLGTWSLLPQEIKDVLDKEHLVYLGIIFMVLSILGRIVSQSNTSKRKKRIQKQLEQKEKEDGS